MPENKSDPSTTPHSKVWCRPGSSAMKRWCGAPAWSTGNHTGPFVGTIEPVAVPVDGGAGETRFCSECGRSYPADELVAFGTSVVCAACKPGFTQKLREGIRPAGAVRYGGFWIRYLAVLIDSLILSVVTVIVFAIGISLYPVDWANVGRSQADLMQLLAIEGVVWFFALIANAVYETWMIGRYGATLGKMACGLRVVTSDGGKVSYGRSLGRHFAKMLSSFILFIGYIMAGFDEEKRALHDRICDTRVIKK